MMSTEIQGRLISIIITALNEGANVRRTVESILEHTNYPRFEVVLINDGSDDGSFEFLESEPYRSDAHLRPIRMERSVGFIRARHHGVLLARGEHILFLDAHVAVPPGWLARLSKALEQWGPYAVITPDIAGLNEDTWSPNPSSGQIVTIDEKLYFVWRRQTYATRLAPTVLGCCVLMPRCFYYQIGGYDLGLRRWGCSIDFSLKAYAAGGACYYEPSVVVGHLFRSAFPYPVRYRDVTYNKLRTGYIHFSDESFRRLLDHLTSEPGFAEAMADFRADLSELDHLRRTQRAANRRDPDWFVRMFLPGLCGQSRPESSL